MIINNRNLSLKKKLSCPGPFVFLIFPHCLLLDTGGCTVPLQVEYCDRGIQRICILHTYGFSISKSTTAIRCEKENGTIQYFIEVKGDRKYKFLNYEAQEEKEIITKKLLHKKWIVFLFMMFYLKLLNFSKQKIITMQVNSIFYIFLWKQHNNNTEFRKLA